MDYTKNIIEIMDRQKAKGLRKYGHGIENWDAGLVEILTNIEEELVDALYYIESAKDHASVPPNSNTCVCCGAEIPEGRMVCPECEAKSERGLEMMR